MKLDTNGDGTLSLEEVKLGYREQMGKMISNYELEELFKSSDLNLDGALDYHEFASTACNREKLCSKENLRKAFDAFDKDNSGSIDTTEL